MEPRTRRKTPGDANASCSPGNGVPQALLLDEMFSGIIAGPLRAKGHDVLAVVADPALVALSDERILAQATSAGRALVTANIKDFVPLDRRYHDDNRAHAGLILVSTKTFPQGRSTIAAIVGALSALLDQPSPVQPGQVVFLSRPASGTS